MTAILTVSTCFGQALPALLSPTSHSMLPQSCRQCPLECSPHLTCVTLSAQGSFGSLPPDKLLFSVTLKEGGLLLDLLTPDGPASVPGPCPSVSPLVTPSTHLNAVPNPNPHEMACSYLQYDTSKQEPPASYPSQPEVPDGFSNPDHQMPPFQVSFSCHTSIFVSKPCELYHQPYPASDHFTPHHSGAYHHHPFLGQWGDLLMGSFFCPCALKEQQSHPIRI